MTQSERNTPIHRFNQEIESTFGKLDARDMERLGGRPEHLATLLVEYYGWSIADAQAKVDLFMTRLSERTS